MNENIFYPIFAIGDPHCPFLHRPTFEKILKIIEVVGKRHAKIYVVIMGDLYDLYSFSKFTQRLRLTPKDELKEGRAQADEMIRLLKLKAPNAEIHVISGNHDFRIASRIYEKFGSALDGVLNLQALWNFDGVNTVFNPKEVLVVQGVNFFHGHLTQIGQHLGATEFQNCVHGHTHRGGVYYQRLSTGKIVWELDAGYTGDPFSPELNYRPLNKYFKWTHGLGMIDASGPRFIPLGE